MLSSRDAVEAVHNALAADPDVDRGLLHKAEYDDADDAAELADAEDDSMNKSTHHLSANDDEFESGDDPDAIIHSPAMSLTSEQRFINVAKPLQGINHSNAQPIEAVAESFPADGAVPTKDQMRAKSQRIKRQMAQRRERESEPKQKPITVIEDVTYPALPSSPNKREGVGDGRDIKSRDNIRATAPQSRALGKRVRDASNDTDAVRAEDAKRRRLALMEILNQLDVEDFEEDERGAFAW